MLARSSVQALLALVCLSATASAQIGAMSLVDSLPTSGQCRTSAATERLKRDGVARNVALESDHPDQFISLGINERGLPRILVITANRPLTSRKSEGESLVAYFTTLGRVTRGSRRYMTLGTPASMSEDRKAGLFAADTAKIERLVAAMLKRCGS
jgi:hypothetical protein